MPDAVTCNLKYGATFNLKKYGGGNVDLVIHEADIASISVTIIDNDHLLPVPPTFIESSGYWTNPGAVPRRTKKQIEKKNGVAIPGTVSLAYLIYSTPTVRVFYFDSIATEQNSCILFIVQHPAT